MGNAMRLNRTARIALFFVAVVTLGLAGSLLASPAHAASPCDPYSTKCTPIVPPTIVQRARQFRVPEPDPPVPPVVIDKRERLPFTGADLTLFAATGFAAVGTGTILVRATRRRRVTG
ncbi:MAG TPA: hypothetical protein VHJ76_05955 [Actinomycetota bacterium]|nr:hypothetical protein [Actinomycetota bacterium]